jgi:hypothetical protein
LDLIWRFPRRLSCGLRGQDRYDLPKYKFQASAALHGMNRRDTFLISGPRDYRESQPNESEAISK